MITINPTTAPIEKRDVDTLLALISLLADPGSTKKALAEIAEKKAEADRLFSEAAAWRRQTEADRERASQEIAAAAADHASKMQQERQAIADERARHAAEAQSRQEQINELHAKASADAKAAADLKADIARRIALVTAP